MTIINDFTSEEIVLQCKYGKTQCYFPNCEYDMMCKKEDIMENKNIGNYMEYHKKLNEIASKKKEYHEKLIELNHQENELKENQDYSFEEFCKDITAIFLNLDIQRPHIHPYDDGVVISIGEDTFNADTFPVPLELFNMLDKYIGCKGELTITNNSMGDSFLPHLNLIYKF